MRVLDTFLAWRPAWTSCHCLLGELHQSSLTGIDSFTTIGIFSNVENQTESQSGLGLPMLHKFIASHAYFDSFSI